MGHMKNLNTQYCKVNAIVTFKKKCILSSPANFNALFISSVQVHKEGRLRKEE